MDGLHDLLRRLATRELPSGRHQDSGGVLRLIVPQYAFADHLDLVIGEVWHYGADSAQIPARLRSLLADLDSAALPANRARIAYWQRQIGAGTAMIT